MDVDEEGDEERPGVEEKEGGLFMISMLPQRLDLISFVLRPWCNI